MLAPVLIFHVYIFKIYSIFSTSGTCMYISLLISIIILYLTKCTLHPGHLYCKLQQEDLFDNLPEEVKSKYKQNPIGNSPESMPLDAHLNQDMHPMAWKE